MPAPSVAPSAWRVACALETRAKRAILRPGGEEAAIDGSLDHAPPRWRAQRCTGLLLAGALAPCLWLPGGAALGQPVGGLLGALQGGSDRVAPVDEASEQQSLETARRSFEHAARATAERIVGSAEDAALSEAAIEAHVESHGRAFAAGARERLIALEGDGLLSRSELSEALGDEREAQLEALAVVLRAALDGADPPPERKNSWGSWALAMAHYTLVERNPPLRWGACLGMLLGALVLAGLAARGLVRAARRLEGRGARRTAHAAASLSGPLYLTAMAVGVRIALDWVWLPFGAAEWILRGSSTLVAISLLWIAWNAADGLAGFVAWVAARTRHRAPDDEAVDLLRKGLRIAALAAFGAFLANTLFGVELGSIVATVGVIGVVISIAAQDTLRNMMGAFTVYGDHPFAVGDLVRVKGYFGRVEDIGFRSTRVRTLTGHEVTIPNAEVVREAVENVSARPSVRHHYPVDIVYSTPPDRVERALEILREILEESDPPDDQPPRISFEEFGPYSLRLMLWYYSDTSDYWEAREHRSRVNRTILERFGEEGLEFAFPTRSVHLLASDPAGPDEGDDD